MCRVGGMSNEAEEETFDIAEYVDDSEVLRLLRQPAGVAEAILEAKSIIVDHSAIGTIRNLMEASDSDAVRLQAVQTWLANRVKLREIRSKQGRPDQVFNFNFATNEEVSNVKQTRRVFGLETVEDAKVAPNDDE